MWAVLLAGYFAFSRDFSYLGIPPVFIGEAYLFFKVVENTRNWISRFVTDAMRLRLLPAAIAMHLSWGIIEVGRSWCMGRGLLMSVRTAAFNYYPLYALIGIVIGGSLTKPAFIRVLKLVVVVYAVRTLIADITKVYPISTPGSPAIVPIIMIAMWAQLRDWKWKYPLLLICTYQMFFSSHHGRGPLLGLVAGILAIAVSSWSRFVRFCMGTAALMILLMFVGPLIPGPSGGGPPLDPVVQIARIIASDHPDAAIRMIKWRANGKLTGDYADEMNNLIGARGTAMWRQEIWKNAMHSLNTPLLRLMGNGEATSLQDLTPDGQDIHTPHNISIYAIYYTGWVGLGTFFFLMFALWHESQQLVDPRLRVLASAVIWSSLLITLTGNFMEAPFGAIPFYLFIGVIIGLDRQYAALAKQSRRLARVRRVEQHAEEAPSYSPSPRPMTA
jgi:hypothetical protein